jgi:predicted transcriptional regulator
VNLSIAFIGVVLMSKYRDRLQIIADVLSIANRRAKKTQIMYQANLSYRLLCRYLKEVSDAGLVSFEKKGCYVLTARGREFLNRHQEYSKRRRSLTEHLSHVNHEKNVLEKMCSNTSKMKNNLILAGRNRN